MLQETLPIKQLQRRKQNEIRILTSKRFCALEFLKRTNEIQSKSSWRKHCKHEIFQKEEGIYHSFKDANPVCFWIAHKKNKNMSF